MAAEPQTAFISYSREDSEFALRLAADLKAAGAAVWLDRLDIAPGQRWARAVEDALVGCPRLLVILSPASVVSANVEDEISVAIEERKSVIPVLYRDCRIPLRLRSIHYVDFRNDYDRALKELLRTLPASPSQPARPLVLEEIPPALPKPDPSPPAANLPSTQKDRTQSATPTVPNDLHITETEGRSVSEASPASDPAPSKPSSKKRSRPRSEARQARRQLAEPAKPSIPVVFYRTDFGYKAGLWLRQIIRLHARKAAVAAVCGILIVAAVVNGSFPVSWHTWKPQNSGIKNKGLTSVAFPAPGSGWAVGSAVFGGGFILHTDDGGESWKSQGSYESFTMNSVYFPTPQSGWAVGTNFSFGGPFASSSLPVSRGTILHTDDAGVTWKAQGTDEWLLSVFFPTPESGWAVGDGGLILHTENSGRTWSGQKSGTTVMLHGVAFPTAQSGWAVGEGGTIVHTDDGGQTWRHQISGTTVWLGSVAFATPQTGWAVGDRGTILHTEDGGLTWTNQSSGPQENLNSVVAITAQSAWIVGDHGYTLHTENGGESWKAQAKATTQNLYSVTFPTPESGWAVGNNGTILHR